MGGLVHPLPASLSPSVVGVFGWRTRAGTTVKHCGGSFVARPPLLLPHPLRPSVLVRGFVRRFRSGARSADALGPPWLFRALRAPMRPRFSVHSAVRCVVYYFLLSRATIWLCDPPSGSVWAGCSSRLISPTSLSFGLDAIPS